MIEKEMTVKELMIKEEVLKKEIIEKEMIIKEEIIVEEMIEEGLSPLQWETLSLSFLTKNKLLSYDFFHFFHFPVISGADEIRFCRHLEAANTEKEYNGQNDTHRLNSRERVLIHRYLQEGGFRSGGRGRNMNFFGQRLSENQPPLHLVSQHQRNQSEERHPQIERNQVSFGRFHGHSQSHVRHISRSHGHPSRRSYSHVRSTPVNSDRPHHDRSVRPHHEYSDGHHHDHSVRPPHKHSDGRHHDDSGRPHHDHSDRHYRDHSGRSHHDHSGRFHLGHTGRAHPSHSGIAHQDHAERAQLSPAGRAHPNYTGLAHHNHAGRVNHDHSGRAHNNRTWRSRSHEERYREIVPIQTIPVIFLRVSRVMHMQLPKFSSIREMTEYLLDQEQQRNELININRGVVWATDTNIDLSFSRTKHTDMALGFSLDLGDILAPGGSTGHSTQDGSGSSIASDTNKAIG
ncbi:uncharacterized protein LOC121441120 [Microtus oregoni]|uniref:uncharacterized protein LOC121441120 n=1 Tax=Microtus oregoni TaxID=111838 RepID=UPI001BB22645|nr:uncharacterized protein LOC121441120 [Microtus oregoni]